jgi:predicted dehydrogenase
MTGTDKAITWGILGTGNMASRMVSCIRAQGGEVVAVGSRSNETARRFAEQHRVAHSFDSYESLAAEADVDVVYIATTNDQHFDNAMACIRNGRAVLCEKPMAITVDQTRELIDTARAAGVLLVEAMWMRFQPFIPVLDRLIRDNTIGPVRCVAANFGFPIPEDPASRWYDAKLGGGSLLDLGVYPLTLAHYLLGEPEKTFAAANLSSTGVDTQCSISSTHAGESMSTLSCSFSAASAAEAVIAGDNGRIRLVSPFYHCPEIVIQSPSGSAVRTIYTDYDGDGLECEIAEVHRCLRDALLESPSMPHADSMAVASWRMAILDQVGVRYQV